ncbi:MAG: FtsX-like permease family protein [Saprospiraceae bacterium]
MNFPLLIARRYLFAKRSTNAINIITGISVLGMAIGTAALVLVLSVFNGFEDLLSGLFGHFNPELKITPAKGKTFEVDSITLDQIRALPGVANLSETLEEIAFFEYEGSQDFGALKGVDSLFAPVTGFDSDTIILEGEYLLTQDGRNCAIVGAGLRNKLTVDVNNPVLPLTVYMPERQTGLLDKPFKTRLLFPTGTFAIQQEYDNQYVITNIDFMREMLEAAPSTVSALEIKCHRESQIPEVKEQIRKILGEGYVLKDHYEQNEAFFKVMKLEKWMGFAITSLMLLLMAFNTVGALWMIVLDKQKDISVLKSMGASDRAIRRIFLFEGLLLTALGMVIGIVFAIIIYIIQKNYGIVTIPDGFLVNTYPISMRISDFIPIALTVLGIGFLASLLPAKRAGRVLAFHREE